MGENCSVPFGNWKIKIKRQIVIITGIRFGSFGKISSKNQFLKNSISGSSVKKIQLIFVSRKFLILLILFEKRILFLMQRFNLIINWTNVEFVILFFNSKKISVKIKIKLLVSRKIFILKTLFPPKKNTLIKAKFWSDNWSNTEFVILFFFIQKKFHKNRIQIQTICFSEVSYLEDTFLPKKRVFFSKQITKLFQNPNQHSNFFFQIKFPQQNIIQFLKTNAAIYC